MLAWVIPRDSSELTARGVIRTDNPPAGDYAVYPFMAGQEQADSFADAQSARGFSRGDEHGGGSRHHQSVSGG